MLSLKVFLVFLVFLASVASARDLSTGTVKIGGLEKEDHGASLDEFGNGAGASGGGGWMSDFAQEGCDCTCDCPEEEPDCSCVCDWCGDEVDQATMKQRRQQRRRRLGTFPPPESLYY